MARELIYHAKSSLLLRAACHLMLGRSWVSSMMSEWERVSWLTVTCVCLGGWCTGDGKGSAPFGFKYFQPWPNMESMLCQHLNVFFLGRFSRKPKNNGVGSLSLLQCIFWPRNQTRVSCIASGFFNNWAIKEAQIGIVILEKYSLIGRIKCEWVKGLPDVIRICICQGKTKNPSLSLQRWLSWPWGGLPGWENLPLGDAGRVSSVVCLPLWMPAGVVTAKSSSVPLGVEKGSSGVPWVAGFVPACPAGRIPFWASGLVWLVGRMAPANKGWKIRPVKIWEVPC